MKYLQSPDDKDSYALYDDDGPVVAIIEFEPSPVGDSQGSSADGEKLIRLIASAPALLALLTEPIQNYHTISLDFATDLECDADIIKEAGFKVRAAGLRAKAQAIRAALAAVRGEAL